jgi:F-type H+-transporting ATPase subunit alpha
VEVNKVNAYEAALLMDLRASGKGILQAIREKKALDDKIETELKAFLDAFTKGFVGNETKKAA